MAYQRYLTLSSSKWPGVLRWTPLLVLFNLLFSLVVLILASVYVNQALGAQIDAYAALFSHPKRPTLSAVASYSLIIPVLGLVHTMTDIVLSAFGFLQPVYALIGSVLFFIAWTTQGIIWINCEDGLTDSTDAFCFQEGLEAKGGLGYGHLKTVSVPASVARQVIAILIATSYCVILGFSAAAVHKARTATRSLTTPEGEKHESWSPSSSVA